MIQCATQKLAKDGSMTSKDVRALLDATNQIVNDTSKALKARNTGKRKRDNNEEAECSDHLDLDASAEFADMDIDALKNYLRWDIKRRRRPCPSQELFQVCVSGGWKLSAWRTFRLLYILSATAAGS